MKRNVHDRLDALSSAIADLKLRRKRGGVMSRFDMDALESDINEAFFLLNRDDIQSCMSEVTTTVIT